MPPGLSYLTESQPGPYITRGNFYPPTDKPPSFIYNIPMKRLLAIIAFTFILSSLNSQESLKSTEENYYDFLSLVGKTDRPTLNYRTLSDSEWITSEDTDHPWKNQNLGKKHELWKSSTETNNWFTKGLNLNGNLKIYGPEWFNSYNTEAPYGQNDGALWQGRGYNTSLSAGARFEALGFEVTVKPMVCFSENRNFEYINSNYPEFTYASDGTITGKTIYAGKASKYGYYGVRFIDAPQRFGDKSFWDFDWGDTEIRWSWHNFTTGFGTQAPWIGPAHINPIIHSNNAASYPKFDIGLRKTSIFMPHFGWHLGDIEFRGWWGKLTESDWFDNDDSNNDTLIAGVSAAYAFPGIFKGFSVGFNRTMLSHWNLKDKYSLFRIYVPNMHGGDDESDQRFSLTFDYLLPIAGLDLYLEWARNDFSPNMDFIVRYPFHTQGWTFGTKKSFIIKENYGLNLLLELTYLELSADYDRLINWYATFYAHHKITQGYTNKGQWLGAGIGTGGNSQYLGVEFYYPKGSVELFAQRTNPDLDYTMYIDAKNDAENIKNGDFIAERSIYAKLDFGISTMYFYNTNLQLFGKIVFDWEHNPLNINTGYGTSNYRYNFVFQAGVKYSL